MDNILFRFGLKVTCIMQRVRLDARAIFAYDCIETLTICDLSCSPSAQCMQYTHTMPLLHALHNVGERQMLNIIHIRSYRQKLFWCFKHALLTSFRLATNFFLIDVLWEAGARGSNTYALHTAGITRVHHTAVYTAYTQTINYAMHL